MIKKLNLKLILVETTFVFLFITGLKRLYLSSQSEIYKAIIEEDYNKFESLTDLTMGEVLYNQYLWPLGFLVVAILIVGLINWRFKIPIINSVLILIIGISFFPLGLINGDYLPLVFNSFCYLFSNDMKTAYIIGGLILSGVAFTLLWFGLNPNKKLCTTKPKLH